jgi:hypothetical protein
VSFWIYAALGAVSGTVCTGALYEWRYRKERHGLRRKTTFTLTEGDMRKPFLHLIAYYDDGDDLVNGLKSFGDPDNLARFEPVLRGMHEEDK